MLNLIAASSKKSILVTAFTLLLFSLAQPQIVMITKLGYSVSCAECSILEQTFLTAILYVFLPMLLVFFVLQQLKWNRYVISGILTAYFTITSFLFLSVPLFRDRYATYSTFADDEIIVSAVLSSFSTQLIVSGVFFLLIQKTVELEK
ncbi:MAG: hypothetical protein HWE22_08200 [Flavobacteriales bacterium]|nr:hypothetical protein [Flavobacteriales bacterium]